MKGLKIILWICALCCLSGFVLAALPLRFINGWFEWAGFQAPLSDAINVYILRLFLATLGLIGIFYLILALNPLKYGPMLLLAGYGLICCGAFCLVGGIRYSFPLWMYGGDVLFGIVAGALILYFRTRAIAESISTEATGN